MKFSERLTEFRKKNGLSQEDLAKKIGVHMNVVGRYERGEASPSLETSVNIANTLNISLDFLVGRTDTLTDQNILGTVLTIQNLPEQDKEKILFTLNALLRDAKARTAYS